MKFYYYWGFTGGTGTGGTGTGGTGTGGTGTGLGFY